MNSPVTTHTGSLGSTLHVLRTDAGTVTALAGVDWKWKFSMSEASTYGLVPEQPKAWAPTRRGSGNRQAGLAFDHFPWGNILLWRILTPPRLP